VLLACLAQQPALAADGTRRLGTGGTAFGPPDPPDDPCVPGTACDPVYCNTPSTCPPALGTFEGRHTKSASIYGSTYTYSLMYDPHDGIFMQYRYHDWGFFPQITYDNYCYYVAAPNPSVCPYSSSYPIIRLDHWQFDIHDRDNFWTHPAFQDTHSGSPGATVVDPASGTSGGQSSCISNSSYWTWCMNSLYEAEAWYDTDASSPCVALNATVTTPWVEESGWYGGNDIVSVDLLPINDNGVCR
jgi:hypothetical protein